MDKVTRPRRFYAKADISAQDASGFSVTLDGRLLRTPARQALILPTSALAQAIADEWNAQGETLDLQRMTLTRLANVALDRTPDTRPALIEELIRYFETDLVCYLSPDSSALRLRQDKVWGPLRQWIGQSLSITLIPVEGILASPQPQASLEAARAYASTRDDFRLTGLNWAAALFGSAVLASGLEQGHLSALDAFTAACLDEDWQAEQWGRDEEAAQARIARQQDAEALNIWFQTL